MANKFTSVLVTLLLIVSYLNAGNPLIRPAGSATSYQLPKNVTASEYSANTIILKVKPEYRSKCGENSINIPEVQKLLSTLSSPEVVKMFANERPPATVF